MPFNIEDFKTKLASVKGVAQTDKFDVNITTTGFAWAKALSDNLQFLCRAAQIPGLNIDIGQIKRYSTSYNIPYPTSNINFGTFSCVFILDATGIVQTFFKNWADNIINPEQASGASGETYRVSYASDYVTDIEISHYDSAGNIVNTYKFVDAFPTTLTPIYMDWNSQNQMAELIVTFVYRNWNIESANSYNTVTAVTQSTPVVGTTSLLPATNPVSGNTIILT